MDRRQFIQNAAISVAGIPFATALLHGKGFLFPGDPPEFKGAEVFHQIMKAAWEGYWPDMPIGTIIGNVAMELQGTPYVGSTLELYNDKEVCSVNLLGLDCVTLFESALGFARMLKTGGRTIPEMMKQVTYTRYRDGILTDYTSRLHYTSEWFYNNQEKGVVEVYTQGLTGAKRFTKTVNFMSTHPDSYPQLKANPAMVPVIAEIERKLNAREMYYLPKERVADMEDVFMTGDIVGITTTIDGIDCSHTGLCYRDVDDKLRFLHASLTHKKVMLDAGLHTYLNSVSKHAGIMIARPLEPVKE